MNRNAGVYNALTKNLLDIDHTHKTGAFAPEAAGGLWSFVTSISLRSAPATPDMVAKQTALDGQFDALTKALNSKDVVFNKKTVTALKLELVKYYQAKLEAAKKEEEKATAKAADSKEATKTAEPTKATDTTKTAPSPEKHLWVTELAALILELYTQHEKAAKAPATPAANNSKELSKEVAGKPVEANALVHDHLAMAQLQLQLLDLTKQTRLLNTPVDPKAPVVEITSSAKVRSESKAVDSKEKAADAKEKEAPVASTTTTIAVATWFAANFSKVKCDGFSPSAKTWEEFVRRITVEELGAKTATVFFAKVAHVTDQVANEVLKLLPVLAKDTYFAVKDLTIDSVELEPYNGSAIVKATKVLVGKGGLETAVQFTFNIPSTNDAMEIEVSGV